MKQVGVHSFFGLLTIGLLSSSAWAADKSSAIAILEPKNNTSVNGKLTFVEQDKGVLITGTISGLTPGKHGFHIHEKGDCSAHDAESAGEHFNPENKDHGGPNSQFRHLGDFGNIEADENGVAKVDIHDGKISLNGASTIIGRSVIVHQNADDLQTQPSGLSGQRIACGKIVHN